MSINCYTHSAIEHAIPILALSEADYRVWLKQQTAWQQAYLKGTNFAAKPGSMISLPDPTTGQLSQVLLGVSDSNDMWSWGALPAVLPAGEYAIANTFSAEQLYLATLAWGLGAYQFKRYKEVNPMQAKLAFATQLDSHALVHCLHAHYLARDLINMPAQDLGPAELAEAARKVAAELGAEFKLVDNQDLLQREYPCVYAVGRASERKPCVVDLQWGDVSHPKVTLIGKGVCFDTGGLNLKTGQGMRLMKKDMGGAAHALALGQWLMQAKLPIRLRVLLPLVENAIHGNAFRPGDVIRSRKGLTIEIDNTDAEGRLILCDVLAQAVEEQPELLIDFATLTGAARVALGPELPALFSNQDTIANDLLICASQQQDLLWRMPLHRPYRELLKSAVADISNATNSSYAGAITAALFLQEFVPNSQAWLHLDLMAWNTSFRPGRAEGGEAMGLRAVFAYLAHRYHGKMA
jgi:leucyl aminopeptidase